MERPKKVAIVRLAKETESGSSETKGSESPVLKFQLKRTKVNLASKRQISGSSDSIYEKLPLNIPNRRRGSGCCGNGVTMGTCPNKSHHAVRGHFR